MGRRRRAWGFEVLVQGFADNKTLDRPFKKFLVTKLRLSKKLLIKPEYL